MAKKQFKAESKRLLDLMINSIYTHKEIFLREIISNASDAIDKLSYLSLTDHTCEIDRDAFAIQLAVDKDSRMLSVTDNGIGMTKEELENNLGTIAKSGSRQFKEEMEKQETIDIIGQFGVGFYSAFMVSDKIVVVTRKYGEEQGWKWISSGADGYTVEPCEKAEVGTSVMMYLKSDTEEENYSDFLQQWRLQNLVKKYSDYIRYPIKLETETSHVKEGTETQDEPEYETVVENKTINSMIPIWQRSKSELKDEDYAEFYKERFHDYEDPLATIHVSVEGAVTYKALLFIPARLPYDFNSKDFKKSLQLYSSGVMIMENCDDLLPNHFAFVKGIVDSQDLSLNISRELLQHDRQLKTIAKNLDKKVRAELQRILKDDREKYEKIWNTFGRSIKYGIAEDYGARKEDLQDLVMFWSSKEQKLITLSEYKDAMGSDQKFIYHASGETREHVASLPQMERLQGRGYDVLLFTDAVDDFLPEMLHNYKDTEFKSITADDLGLDSDEDKKAMEDRQAADKELLDAVTAALDGKIKSAVLSMNLGSHAVAVRPDGGVTFEMEKYFARMNPEMAMKADRVLELNPEHPVFTALREAKEQDEEKLKQYAQMLYNQALLLADLPMENPMAFVDAVCGLMK